jgi:hypothetical protein
MQLSDVSNLVKLLDKSGLAQNTIVIYTSDQGFFLVNLDTFGDKRFDYYALIGSDGRRFRASLWRDRQSKRAKRIAKLKSWRASKDSVSVRIPLRKLRIGPARHTFRWYVQTLFIGPKCRRVRLSVIPSSRK